MIANEGLHTTLTWSQLAIGLIAGMAGIYLSSATERIRRTFIAEDKQKPDNSPMTPDRQSDTPHVVINIVRAAYYALGVVAAGNEAIPLRSMVRRVHTAQKLRKDRNLLPNFAIHTALERLISQQSVRHGRLGLSITESGTELLDRLARINETSPSEREESSTS